ncbi:L,D-transpeptidase family protein [Thiovibrio sp. JS02]
MDKPSCKAILSAGVLFLFGLFHGGCATKPAKVTTIVLPPPPPPVAQPPQEEVPENTPLEAPLKSPKIVIKKTKKKLYLYSEERLLRAYPIKLGYNPVDDKVRQGDRCTPEGEYYICIKNPQSKYHLSLGLSYPNVEDAKRGLENKLISQREFDAIAQRISKKSIPPWNTPLGGEIFIHGGGETWDWTYGCVALHNKDIEELYKVIGVGTEVIIQK